MGADFTQAGFALNFEIPKTLDLLLIIPPTHSRPRPSFT